MKLKLTLILSMFLLFASPALAQASSYVGSTGSAVVVIQTELNTLGYPVGTADGIFGNLTKQGVVKFQKANGLVADGIVGPITERALIASYNAKLRQNKTNDIVYTSKKYIGTPYKWSGTTTSGFDCSGYTQYVFKQNGITIPRVSRDQAKVGTTVSYGNLQPGDLVFFSFAQNGIVDHVGMYLGDGKFIGAQSSTGVAIVTISPYWSARYVTAKRVY